MSDTEEYTEGYKAGYAVGFADGKGAGYVEAKVRTYMALDAVTDANDANKGTIKKVDEALRLIVGGR